MLNEEPDAVLARLLVRYAPAAHMQRHRLGWLLDGRLAAVARGARDPMIAAIRMAWWRDALVADDRSKGRGEPLVDALRALSLEPADRAAIDRMIDGWSLLLAEEPLDDAALVRFGMERGGGLFALLAGSAADPQGEAIAQAGAIWALWDMAAHVADRALAQAAIDEAAGIWQAGADVPAGPALKPQRLAMRVALVDVRERRLPRGGFAPRHYARVLLHGLLG